jgi:hypothetical protein
MTGKIQQYAERIENTTGEYGAIAYAAGVVMFNMRPSAEPRSATKAEMVKALEWVAGKAAEVAAKLKAES